MQNNIRHRREWKSWKFICFSIYAKTPINHVWERLAPGAFEQTLSTRAHRKSAVLLLRHNKMFYQNSWHNCRVFNGCISSSFNSRVERLSRWRASFLHKLFLVLPGNHRITQSIWASSRQLSFVFIIENIFGFLSLEIPSQVDNSSNQCENHSQ